jgi:hypothetical protein
MNNEDSLSDALAKNGSFDAGRADEIRTQALSSFDASQRKVDRWLMGYLCLCSWLFVFAFFHFIHTASTKAFVFYGLLMLMFFETTILMKLWYWMMNNKISVLKALKELELGQASAAGAATTVESATLRGPLKGISRGERRVWWLVLAAGAGAIGAIKGAEPSQSTGTSLVHDGVVTLAADGSGAAETHFALTNDGVGAVEHFNFYAPEGYDVSFLDSDGHELPTTTSHPADTNHVRYDVSLRRWAWPGSQVDYTRVEKGDGWAKQTDGLWSYAGDYEYVDDTTRFTQTVTLPPTAAVVSATPWPATMYTLGDRTALRFEGVRGRNQRFKFSVQYRLPAGG